MNDHEMLEFAAKAAGIEYHVGLIPVDGVSIITTEGKKWNPLLDGDKALWLVVMLGIDIQIIHPRDSKELGRSRAGQMWELHDGNPWAATRRAIVRAAAEIGKAKKLESRLYD